jgi:hypothetical protein
MCARRHFYQRKTRHKAPIRDPHTPQAITLHQMRARTHTRTHTHAHIHTYRCHTHTHTQTHTHTLSRAGHRAQESVGGSEIAVGTVPRRMGAQKGRGILACACARVRSLTPACACLMCSLTPARCAVSCAHQGHRVAAPLRL